MLECFILLIDRKLDHEEFCYLLKCVSERKRERIQRFYRFEDIQRTLLGDILVRYSVCKRLAIRNKELVFGTGKYEKPFLLYPNRIHFNISHSEDCVVCAIDDEPLGIDIEIEKPIDLKIAEQFFSKDEYIAIQSQPQEARQKYFYLLWTLKESYIKAEGKGLSIPLDSFTISFDGNRISLKSDYEFIKHSFYQYELFGKYIMSICTNNKILKLTNVSFSQIYEEIKPYL